MPIGVPLPGGIPIGGPIGGLIPGGGTDLLMGSSPGGGAPRPIGGGGPPRPGGYWVGAPAILAVAAAAAAATVPLPYGPPTPRTGPASPAGAWGMGTPAGIPLPAALPIPGPPAAPASGGPSTVIETRFSPRSSTRPRTRFSSLSSTPHLIFLNSSQSQRIKFMCLSKALKVPMKIRPSCRIHLIL
uniref:Elastin n=1 Tax=Saimiri boliviensis boliviensis TaxID=39432 RepID=A0A2K6T743_SAIBB